MSDEEDFDEFPSITVNSSIHESSSFSMPSAEQLATERARELECESAILRLREEHNVADIKCGADADVDGSSRSGLVLLSHSDSSSSEGEVCAGAAAAALAAAVCALRVAPAPAPPRRQPLLRALLARLPEDPLLVAYRDAILSATSAAAHHALLLEISACVSDMVLETASAHDVHVWPEEHVLSVLACLCAAVVEEPPAGGRAGGGERRALLRMLHLLLEEVATENQMDAIRDVVLCCVAETDSALLLCDALCCGGGARATDIARSLARAALAHLASLTEHVQDVTMEAISRALCGAGGGGVWRRLTLSQQYNALQLVARLVTSPAPAAAAAAAPECEAAVGRAMLDALAQAMPSQRAHTTEQLKVVVAATKLQVLFHVHK